MIYLDSIIKKNIFCKKLKKKYGKWKHFKLSFKMRYKYNFQHKVWGYGNVKKLSNVFVRYLTSCNFKINKSFQFFRVSFSKTVFYSDPTEFASYEKFWNFYIWIEIIIKKKIWKWNQILLYLHSSLWKFPFIFILVYTRDVVFNWLYVLEKKEIFYSLLSCLSWKCGLSLFSS